MRKIDLSRPDLLFGVIWIMTPLLAFADLYGVGFSFTPGVSALILANVVSFPLIYRIVERRLVEKVRLEQCKGSWSEGPLVRAMLLLFVIWTILYAYIVWRSGGVPMFWKLAHINKSYIDFGLSTLSGLANMVRNFVFCLAILLYMRHRVRLCLAIAIVLLISSIIELARANTIFLLLGGAAVILINLRVGARTLLAIIIAAAAMLPLFGVVESARSPGGSGGEKMLEYDSILSKLPYGVTSAYMYLSMPVNNLYFADEKGIKPLKKPYYSVQLIVPTIIREQLFSAHEYPIALRWPVYNTTTFYSPFIADFGIFAAALLTALIQFLISYVHIRARRGELPFQLIYAPLFTSISLSFFFNYFLTLGVLLFPLLTYLCWRWARIDPIVALSSGTANN